MVRRTTFLMLKQVANDADTATLYDCAGRQRRQRLAHRADKCCILLLSPRTNAVCKRREYQAIIGTSPGKAPTVRRQTVKPAESETVKFRSNFQRKASSRRHEQCRVAQWSPVVSGHGYPTLSPSMSVQTTDLGDLTVTQSCLPTHYKSNFP